MSARDSIVSSSPSTPRGGLALSCAILLVAMGLVLIPLGLWAQAAHGAAGVETAALAWSLCTASALIALVVSASLAATPYALHANLGVMLIRMGAPLVGAAMLPRLVPSLATAGWLPSLLVCYLAALVLETTLAIRHIAGRCVPATQMQARPSAAKQSNAKAVGT